MSDAYWYATIVGLAVLAFIVICAINIRIQRARLREEARMTPEEVKIKRAEDKAFYRGIWRRG